MKSAYVDFAVFSRIFGQKGCSNLMNQKPKSSVVKPKGRPWKYKKDQKVYFKMCLIESEWLQTATLAEHFILRGFQMVNGNYKICDKLTQSKWRYTWQIKANITALLTAPQSFSDRNYRIGQKVLEKWKKEDKSSHLEDEATAKEPSSLMSPGTEGLINLRGFGEN